MPVYSMRNRVSCANSWITTLHFELERALYDDITADLRPKLREIKVPVTILYAWDNLAPIPQATVDEIYRQNYGSLSNKTLVSRRRFLSLHHARPTGGIRNRRKYSSNNGWVLAGHSGPISRGKGHFGGNGLTQE